MEIRGDLSYWLKRVEDAARDKRAKDPLGRLPEWIVLSPRNWAEIKYLLSVNDHLRYYAIPAPAEPHVFCGLKIAISTAWKADADFLEAA